MVSHNLEDTFNLMTLAPADVVVCAALGDLDVLVRLAHHNYHMVRLTVLILHQVAGSELLPARAVDSPPK